MLNDGQPTVGSALSDVLAFHFDVQPCTARDLGRREFDGRFPDVTRPPVPALMELRDRLLPGGTAGSPAERADVRTAVSWLDREAFRVGVLGLRHRDPVECLVEADVWGYVKQPYASTEEKVAAVQAHLVGVPAFLRQAEEVVGATLPAGQRMHALELSRALAADLRDTVGLLAEEHPGLQAPQLDAPAEAAATACEKFAARVEMTTPEAALLGPELLQEWVRVSEGIDRTPTDLVGEAQAEVDALVAALAELVIEFGVARRRDLYDVMERPEPGQSVADCVAPMVDRLRQFWTDRDVVGVETRNPLLYRTRPRMFAAAEFGIVGPLNRPHPHHLYLPQKAAQGRHFALPTLEMLAVHETYAGHYVHTEAVFRHVDGVRNSMRLWAGFVEGWAHYAEELAIEQGLADGRPLVRAAHLLAALEAATRLLVYVSVHSRRWTFGEAVQHAAHLCDWPIPQATREVLGATADWRLSLYTFGKLRIREWRRDSAANATPARLRAFHDRLLRGGFAPLAVVRQYALESEKIEPDEGGRNAYVRDKRHEAA
ncbi:DUF885 family protein [Micromonospora sp. NPDC047467]|uniref:DUF885 family protein n=1 Tax=Micromonospora sp. NPDC047467 TaxID=3154814 RepID=UPI0033D79452